MTGPAFVRAVMNRLGAASPADLANIMRWPRGTERTVARWLTGETSPSFDYTMEMVGRAGLLNNDEDVPSAEVAPGDPLEALERKVDLMARRTGQSLARLEAAISQLSQKQPPQEAQGQ